MVRKGRNRGNFIRLRGGTGACGSCKNFVTEECKQCPVRAAQLPSPVLRSLLTYSAFQLFTLFLPRSRLCTREYRFPYANSHRLKARPQRRPVRRWMPVVPPPFFSLDLVNPIAHQRQLHTHKSARQFVSRAQFILLNFTMLYRVARTSSRLKSDPNFDAEKNRCLSAPDRTRWLMDVFDVLDSMSQDSEGVNDVPDRLCRNKFSWLGRKEFFSWFYTDTYHNSLKILSQIKLFQFSFYAVDSY